MALRADYLSDQIDRQQPMAGTVAGNQPAMPQAPIPVMALPADCLPQHLKGLLWTGEV